MNLNQPASTKPGAVQKAISALDAEICFLLKEDFYFGPDRHVGVDTSKFTQSLALPGIPRAQPSMVRTSELLGNERELSAYYKQVIENAIKYRLPFNSIRHHFWVRFWLWNSEEDVHVSFPWYDSYSEISRFLDALITTESGLIDHDMDQGWEMEVHAHDGDIYIRQRDPDSDEIYECIRVPREGLVNHARELMARSRNTIATLTDFLGEDVWTSYVRFEPKFMSPPVLNIKTPWWKIW